MAPEWHRSGTSHKIHAPPFRAASLSSDKLCTLVDSSYDLYHMACGVASRCRLSAAALLRTGGRTPHQAPPCHHAATDTTDMTPSCRHVAMSSCRHGPDGHDEQGRQAPQCRHDTMSPPRRRHATPAAPGLRKRSGSLGSVVTSSRRHVVTSSRRHVVTSSRRHVVTSSRRHVVTSSRRLRKWVVQ